MKVDKKQYPYYLVLDPNGYEVSPIEVRLIKDVEELVANPPKGSMTLATIYDPFDKDGYITDDTVESVVIGLGSACAGRGHPVCLVVAPDRCYYIEKDGSYKKSSDVPKHEAPNGASRKAS
ncbi:MAG: hypothetical protein H6626_01925 [Pseudobdellovibrionaceae bacterium]|nr:hypothetical protein [Bdellovibrionales bacterium]USN47872.1 MAG: hypothetical protein H6626_01925 [Pseudobdellovibrionaceae bacterium]